MSHRTRTRLADETQHWLDDGGPGPAAGACAQRASSLSGVAVLACWALAVYGTGVQP
ncbi:hypothetical protein K6U06_06500 [Acidiferrimicrobium sp. IK]|uniref:hypothetical protein n=1 Tax=Acidiferrimicrobium sp. IK TaxID=2871700 RepID=UPI0021CB68B6|nr:hypothetical protein [Acidiferrimicrobium sp. IK]MCU4184003.1 hypothetical protein [Acidiferrimicrobium sp. IK]